MRKMKLVADKKGSFGHLKYLSCVRSDLTNVLDDGTVVFNENSWCNVENTKNYTIAISSFLARGTFRMRSDLGLD